MTTNNGPAYLFRNDQTAGNRSIRFKLVGTQIESVTLFRSDGPDLP